MKIPFFSKKKTELNLKGSKSKPSSKKSTKVSAKKSSGKRRVTIYSTQTCPWCKKTKEFLKANKISFTNKDVGTNQKYAKEMIEKSGQQGVPVTDINGKIIVGFKEGELKRALGI